MLIEPPTMFDPPPPMTATRKQFVAPDGVKLMLGDCTDVLTAIESNSVDLIITSPPYAMQRVNSYGGIPEDEYVKWFLKISSELYRVLKPSGSFILNIKENARGGTRHNYVIELLLALQTQRWRWVEEYIWLKTNPLSGKWANRFSDAFERCFHFTKSSTFSMFQEAVMVPLSPNTIKRNNSISERDKTLSYAASESGHHQSNREAYKDRTHCYPTNVIKLPTAKYNSNHSAAFPIELPIWFIKLFTQQNDLVLDPFSGGGTTCAAAKQLKRKAIGIEINAKFHQLAKERVYDVE